jgi:hypothetical protein
MAYADQSSFVIAPLARSHAAQSVRNTPATGFYTTYLTSPSLTPPSISLMMEFDSAKTDHRDGSSDAPYE